MQIVVQGRVKVHFISNKDVYDGKADTIIASLKQALDCNDINLDKVAGHGSDGAAIIGGGGTSNLNE